MEKDDLNELEKQRRSKYVELSEVIEAFKESESWKTEEAKRTLCTLELAMLRPVSSLYYEDWSELTDRSSSENIKAMSYLLGGLSIRDVGAEKAHQYDDVSYFWEVPVLVEWCKARGINVPKSWGEWMSGTYPVLIERGLCLDEGGKEQTQNQNPLSPLWEMEGLRFKEIKICIDPDGLVLRISARDVDVRAPFSTLGLTKKNEITLNKQGKIFIALANESFTNGPGTSNAINRLSRALRDAFKTDDCPFDKSVPWFQLYIPKNKAAHEAAAKRTVSYDDTRKVREYDAADEYIESVDPAYDPSNFQ